MRVDVHQHLWPEALIAGLARRAEPPRLRREGGEWWLQLRGEAPARFDPTAHDPGERARRAERDEVGLIGVAPSLPLGIEALPAEEAAPLLAAHHEGVLELGAPFRLWASVPGDPAALEPGALALLLDRGAIGACLPAGALAHEPGLTRAASVLRLLQERDRPLFVHPGPAPAATAGAPSWWPALTAYVAEMQAAWLAWAQWGRRRFPRLRVVFAMLAGGAPLQAERLAARGGPAGAVHEPRTLFEISSYGVRTVDALLRVVGVDRLLLGTDRPVVEPADLASLGPSVAHALAVANPARLLSLDPVPA